MINERKREKSGWILGWIGGFIWILILAIVSLVKGDHSQALVGGVLVVTATTAILIFSPWRYPTQSYWRLMLPLYMLFFLSVAWSVWNVGGTAKLGLSVWSLFLLLPLLMPLYLAGRRRWIDGENRDV